MWVIEKECRRTSSSSSSIPQPRGSLGHHRWFCNQILHFSLFSTALWDLPNSRPVHSLMLSSHLFLCTPCLLPPFTVPCKMVLAKPDERETWPYHCSLRLFTINSSIENWFRLVPNKVHPLTEKEKKKYIYIYMRRRQNLWGKIQWTSSPSS